MHTYAANGTYTVVYVATDDCGRTDTSSFVVEITTTGITEIATQGFRVWSDGSGLVIHDLVGAGTLHLFDMQGRELAAYPIGAIGRQYVAAPFSGVVLWRFAGLNGEMRNGVVVLE